MKALITCVAALLVGAAPVPQPTVVDAARRKADVAVQRADEVWRKTVVGAKKQMVADLVKLRDAALAKQQQDVMDQLNKIIVETTDEITLIEGAPLILNAVVGEPGTRRLAMYDSRQRNPDHLPFFESFMRPQRPDEAYARLTKGMTRKEVIEVMGGYQESVDRGSATVLTWEFPQISHTLHVDVEIESGVVTGFARRKR